MTANKLEALRARLRAYESCVVAYSGGVDSVFLAYVARQELGNRALAVIADTPSLPRRELREALEIAEQFGISVRVVKTKEFDNPNYVANPMERCYYCKHDLFDELLPMAREGGYAVVLYGENASDTGDFRPGAKAAVEHQVLSPLKELGITKAEIREWSAALGLPTSDKPQMACLSSRVPYGEVVTPDKLRMIEEAEDELRAAGFREVRVRHHEVRQGHLARIELPPNEMQRFMQASVVGKVSEALRQIGYQHVTLDILGYRRGSLNEGITGGLGGTSVPSSPTGA